MFAWLKGLFRGKPADKSGRKAVQAALYCAWQRSTKRRGHCPECKQQWDDYQRPARCFAAAQPSK